MSLRKAIQEVLENEKKLDKEFSKLSNKAQTHANNLMRQGAESGDAIARAKKHYNEETVEEVVYELCESDMLETIPPISKFRKGIKKPLFTSIILLRFDPTPKEACLMLCLLKWIKLFEPYSVYFSSLVKPKSSLEK